MSCHYCCHTPSLSDFIISWKDWRLVDQYREIECLIGIQKKTKYYYRVSTPLDVQFILDCILDLVIENNNDGCELQFRTTLLSHIISRRSHESLLYNNNPNRFTGATWWQYPRCCCSVHSHAELQRGDKSSGRTHLYVVFRSQRASWWWLALLKHNVITQTP